MTNTQLYLAIGVPILANAVMLTVGYILLMIHINMLIADLKRHVALWRAEKHS